MSNASPKAGLRMIALIEGAKGMLVLAPRRILAAFAENPAPAAGSVEAADIKISKTSSRANRVELQCETCPLNRVQAGVAVRIKKLCASPETQIRLRELGLGEEQIIRLLTTHTNYICQVCNTRLALSHKLAELIIVESLRPDRRAAA